MFHRTDQDHFLAALRNSSVNSQYPIVYYENTCSLMWTRVVEYAKQWAKETVKFYLVHLIGVVNFIGVAGCSLEISHFVLKLVYLIWLRLLFPENRSVSG